MWALATLSTLLGCPGTDARDSGHAHDSAHAHDGTPAPYAVSVRVTLDGAPAADVLVLQGGGSERVRTDTDGLATLTIDPSIPGDVYVVAAHPDARVDGVEVEGPPAAGTAPLEITLVRFDASDNPAYTFASPGFGDLDATTTAECGHCHRTIHEAWAVSPHRTSASNPVTQDVYGGIALALDEAACAASGFTWNTVRRPGGGDPLDACVTGDGVSDATGGVGACADCHAPGIDGALGGRDLLDATGTAFEGGVHCDVCHKVAAVDLDAAPGVAGRLRIVRPSEEGAPGLGPFAPLSFGPYPDVLNPRMGSVWREEVFHGAELCAGCHEQRQEVLVQGTAIDLGRWPEGRLPIHTTYDEWRSSPVAPTQTCRDCHMPPRPDVGNSADLYNHFDLEPGISAGWERAPGEVRGHHWYGPRQPESGMLRLAATVDVEATRAGDSVEASVTSANVGPAHALPTGEPMRSLLLLVEARCDGRALPVTGGDAVPDVGGALEARSDQDDLSRWPGAAPGQVLRAVRRTGGWRDDPGWGPFGDGTFAPAQKGLPEELAVGESTILAVAADGTVTLDRALPAADVVYRGSGAGLPADGAAATARAGAAGHLFARVLVGADGARMVPHHLAVDVASDNRLLRGAPVTTTHAFDAAGCGGPVSVSAALYHRAYPPDLARVRGWDLADSYVAGESVEVAE